MTVTNPSQPLTTVDAAAQTTPRPEAPEPVLDRTAALAGSGGARGRPAALVIGSMLWLALLVVLVIFADWLPLKPVGVPADVPRLHPGVSLSEPLGTDSFGRSELSRLVHGARVSLAVGIFSTAFAMLIGGLIGSVAGYVGGRVDAFLNLVIDAALAFPALVFLLALAAALRPTVPTLIVIIGVLLVPHFARLARANAVRFASREFVTAARLMGAGHRRILFREIIPNTVIPIATYAFTLIAVVIVAESSLSFLGFGIKPPQPSWGNMINEGRSHLGASPHLVFVPAIAMFLTVFSLNVVGDYAMARLDRRGSML